MKAAIFLLATALTLGTVLGDRVVIDPSADTSIREGEPEQNFGTESSIVVGLEAEAESKALIRFDIGAAVPPGAIITAAALTFEVISDPASNGDPSVLTLHRVLQFWNDDGAYAATWNHRVLPNVGWTRPGGVRGIDAARVHSAVSEVSAAGRTRIPSTPAMVADVQRWLDRPDMNEGWMIVARGVTKANLVALASREDTARAPRLTIHFTPPDPDSLAATAQYEAVFNATWTPQTHPTDFPSNAHWSGLVGGLHNPLAYFWRRNATASEGIQRMAEMGQKTTLLSEVDAAVSSGTATQGLSGPGIANSSGRASIVFTVNRTHPLVTLTSMVAPSPDWFVGVRNQPLIERGRWIAKKTVVFFPYDTGTDSGISFDSANEVTVPRSVINRITTAPLGNQKGYARPMGTMTFRRIK